MSGTISRAKAAEIMYGTGSKQHLKMLALEAAGAPSTAATDAVTETLTDATGEAYFTGSHAGAVELGAHAVYNPGPISDAVVNIDWSSWKPGDTRAAAATAGGALRDRLGDLGLTVKGITDTTLDDIGNRIATGLTAGESSDSISRALRDLVGSSTRADRIVHTEVARAQTTAATSVYRASGVTRYNVLTADDADSECLDIAAAGPYDMSDDTGMVPIHPFCRCADTPDVSSINPDLIEVAPAPVSDTPDDDTAE